MPLSDHEQRQFEQIERTLAAEDPKFVSTVRSMDLRTHRRRRLRRAAVLFVVGFGLLVTGAVANIYLGVAGFLVMLGAGLWVMAISKRAAPPSVSRSAPGATKGAKAKGAGGMTDRFEERWRKRRDDDGRPF